ncbi:FAD-dependent oxidoreductase [Patiriisocius marinistellae]|uniref:FAD-dependent oxidoreductase n=1 Tax=Patiriisocius marinistellae TaxID=2494560 RepID=A0A5J4FV37_9FLAO|nr:FAD-dependent oxidoreductase [Patiriisocius marinistellae]GEQ84924.1 FAD-dependent oxidoreductase [Patiriisocius marinistellae]
MELSYWERKIWLDNIDYAVIGSGIVGLNCALELRKLKPNAKIVIFEKGMLPSGASTKNAGFACFGSLSEILADLNTHSEAQVIQLIKQRVDGLKQLRETLGDATLDYQQLGGYELFSETEMSLFEKCISKMAYINKLLFPIFKGDVFSLKDNPFGFKKINSKVIFNQFEGQIDTGKMMQGLLKKVSEAGILILNNAEITSLKSENEKIVLTLNISEEIKPQHVCIATNGFAKQFLKEDVQPARAQVLITKPIKDLKIKGTFHFEEGYFYFRNIDDRILFGGGRNLDFKTEETTYMGLTPLIQNKLETILRETILPNKMVEIDHRWSGIMGVGDHKQPVLKKVAPHVFCGVRLGGMGVTIGSSIGKKLAALAIQDDTI